MSARLWLGDFLCTSNKDYNQLRQKNLKKFRCEICMNTLPSSRMLVDRPYYSNN